MEETSKNLLIYGVLAIVIIASVSVYLYRLTNQSYSISVSALNITKTAIYPYQTVHFNITISNAGSNPISDMPLGLYSNNAEIGVYKVSLPAHGSTSLLYNYTYQYSGTYHFEAVADPAHVLNILNRSRTQSGLPVDVLAASVPDVYTSLPNNGINYTQSFSLYPGGVALVAYMDNFYNISATSGMLGVSRQISESVFSDLQGLVANMNGAFVRYENGTKAYAIWIQGTADNQTINAILDTFRLRHAASIANGTVVDYYAVNGTTSICSMYQYGWTKVIAYYNSSGPGTCLSLAGRNYTPAESKLLVNTLKNNTVLRHFQSGFYYRNVSILGSSVTYSNSSIGFVNIFQNSYGLFLSTILNTRRPFNTSTTLECPGLIYRNGTNNICSSYVAPLKPANATISLVNTTEVSSDYLVELYSLVNSSNLLNAHYNAVHLVSALGINESSANFTSPFRNSCYLGNASIGCKVKEYNSANNSAAVSITNNFSSPIRINAASCYMPGLRENETIGLNVPESSAVNFTVRCLSIPISATSAITSYTFVLNYTLLNKSRLAVGVLNVSNFVS